MNALTPFVYPLKRLVLSHSTQSGYRSCARRGIEFKKLFGTAANFQELDEFGNPVDNFAADCGKAIHSGFQSFMIDRNEDNAIWRMLLDYPFQAEPFQDNSYRSMEAVYACLMAMTRHEFTSRYEIINIAVKNHETGELEERPAVEVPFCIELTDTPMSVPVFYVGFIDLIVWDKLDEKFMVVDIKSHRDNTIDMAAKYEYDEQCVPYGLILEHILGHEVTEFKVGYLSCYIDLTEPRIRLYDFVKTQDHIKDWFIGLCIDVRQIAYYTDNLWFPRATNGGTCMAFRKKCAWLDVCSYRDPRVLVQILGDKPRETLFHDDTQPWITLKIPYAKEIVG